MSDLQNAYVALYALNRMSGLRRHRHPMHFEMLLDAGFPQFGFWQSGLPSFAADSLPPNARLTLEKVRIESPGFWEFLASSNPLLQLREYLNDRHERRKDREFREASERERLQLENEMIRQRLEKMGTANLRDQIELLRSIGFEENEIRDMIWMNAGAPLSRLGRHQDSGLIGGAE
ncbi:MAG: hypothetical protein OXH79_01460 [Boseongicola sp.]|nr:hypothetical protein [Boseongicola sp.]